MLVSGGGWGVGRLATAIETVLVLPRSSWSSACAAATTRCARAWTVASPRAERVRLEGFTEAMPDWLAAGDALVHSTAGLTVLEAVIRGCPVISFGWGRGHIRPNNAAFRRFGLAEVAETRGELRSALERALAGRRPPDLDYARRPSAASLVLAQAGDDPRRGQRDGGDRHERE